MSTPAQPSLAKQMATFAIGGFSGCVATCCIQPIDCIKVRIQLMTAQYPTQTFTAATEFKALMKTGPLTFYRGLDSALIRQVSYKTATLGFFFNMVDSIKSKNNGQISFLQKSGCSLVAGALGAFVSTPPDLILIRMQTDSTLPADQKRNYKNFVDAAKRIPKEEGITTLWKGGVPTVIRAMALNLGLLTSFEEAKERLSKMSFNKPTVICLSSLIAGTVSATLSLPFDNAKTKMQSQKPLADGTMKYTNIFQAMALTCKEGGPKSMWVGLPTFIARLTPHTVIQLMVLEKLREILL